MSCGQKQWAYYDIQQPREKMLVRMNQEKKAEINFIDASEQLMTSAPKKPEDRYVHGKKKIPKKYTLEEVKDRAALGEKSQIAGSKYVDYKDFRGYYSNQFESNLQNKLYSSAKEDFFDIEDQEDAGAILNINLKPLDIEQDILDDFTVLLIGRRRSGKSFMARWLMYHLRHRFPCGVVITGTKINDFWSSIIPKEFIHDVEDIDVVLDNVFKRQDFIQKHPELGLDTRFFIILDDVLKDKFKLRYSKALSRAFTDGRHYKVFTMITTQDPRGIPADLRENTDLCITFRQFQRGRKEAVALDFLDYIDDKKVQQKFLWKHTSKRTKCGEVHDPRDWIHDKVMPELAKVNNKIDPMADPAVIEKKRKGCDVMSKEGIPQALCTLQSDTTDNLLDIFKIAVAEDPGQFRLGDARYWKALDSGKMKQLSKTFDEFVAKRPRTVNKKVVKRKK